MIFKDIKSLLYMRQISVTPQEDLFCIPSMLYPHRIGQLPRSVHEPIEKCLAQYLNFLYAEEPIKKFEILHLKGDFGLPFC